MGKMNRRTYHLNACTSDGGGGHVCVYKGMRGCFCLHLGRRAMGGAVGEVTTGEQ